ncbi:MAG: hypothetical protein ACXWIN_04185 [Burkholderiaceae bacterium]
MRSNPEKNIEVYQRAYVLLIEKKAIQMRLREVDKSLRELRLASVNSVMDALDDVVSKSETSNLKKQS